MCPSCGNDSVACSDAWSKQDHARKTVVFTGSSLAWGVSMPWVGAQSQPTIESFSTNRRLMRPQMTCAKAPGIFPSIAYWNANRRSSCHKRNAKWKSPIHLVPRTPRFTPNQRELEGGGMPASAALLTSEVSLVEHCGVTSVFPCLSCTIR
jgi:hypothetical protein